MTLRPVTAHCAVVALLSCTTFASAQTASGTGTDGPSNLLLIGNGYLH